MAFDYKLEKNGDIVTLNLAGRLVDKVEAIEISVDIEEELSQGHNKFIIDLSELEYMNSTGLNILINLMNKTRENKGEAVITGSKPRILSLFSVTKLNTVFKICADKEEALNHFSTINSGK